MFRNKLTGEYPVSHYKVKMENPSTIFPANFKEAKGYDFVENTEQPSYNQDTQFCTEGTPEFVDGKWQQTWIVSDLSQEESEANRQLKFQKLLEQFDNALTSHLDSVAQSRRYDNRISCAVRAGFPGPFQQEGITFATWMDQCNAAAYQILEEVQQGIRDVPESTEAFIAELPVIEWATSTTT